MAANWTYCRQITKREFLVMLTGYQGVTVCWLSVVNRAGLTGREALTVTATRCPANRDFVRFSGPQAVIARLALLDFQGDYYHGQATESDQTRGVPGLHDATDPGIHNPEAASVHDGDTGPTCHPQAADHCRDSGCRTEESKVSHLTYLASPYTTDDDDVKARRVEAAARLAGILTDRGELCIPAIPMGTSFLRYTLAQSGTWDTWQRLDSELVRRCDSVTVLCIPGWRDSVGVQAEIALAESLAKPIRYVDRDGQPIGGDCL